MADMGDICLADAIRAFIRKAGEAVHIQDLYVEFPDAHEHSIRGRIYENLGKDFKRVGRGLYVAIQGEAACVVMHGDALEEVKKLESESIEAVITDPPYPWLDKFRDHPTTSWQRMKVEYARREIDLELGLELYRVLKEGAHAFVFVPAETGQTKPPIDNMISVLERCGFVFRKRFIWDKVSPGLGYSGRARYEGILFLTRGTKKRKPCDLGIPDVLTAKMIGPKRRRHPNEKPVLLMDKLIRFATKVGETVLDVFAGSLSTGRAAIAAGRNAILIEKDQAYLEKALC